jgi:plasmid maintenance system killer protein
VIQSFGDATTEDVFHGTNSKAARKIPKGLWAAVRRKLDFVNAATSVKAFACRPATGSRRSRATTQVCSAFE